MNNASRATEPKPSFSIVRILLVVIPVLLIAGAWYVASASKSANQGTDSRLLEKMGFKPTAAQRLDSRFSDANGDLVADAPTDASQQVSPDKLIFSYIGGPDAVEEKDAWQSFAKHLSQQIGKPVEIKSFADTEEQLAALKNGELHITGFNTGAVPTAVNAFGFVPVCVPGRRDSDFGYTMKFIVPAASNVATLADLKGKKITFVDLNSHSGYKAAIIELKKIGLLPDRDYQWGFSTSHDESIKGVAEGRFQAAPVASTLLERAEADGTVKADQIRVISTSERFPPAALGYAYNLSPKLAEKIRGAMLEFDFSGTELEMTVSNPGEAKFVPVSYKDHFAIIYNTDDALAEGALDKATN